MMLSREEHPIFALILAICVETVFEEMDRKEGIVFADLPLRMQAIISISRWVKFTPLMVSKCSE